MTAPISGTSFADAASQAFSSGRFVEAAALLEQALSDRPGQAGLWLNLAQARRAAGDGNGALFAVEQLLRRHPRAPRGLLLKGDLLMADGRQAAAIECWKAALVVGGSAGAAAEPELAAALAQARVHVDDHQQALAERLRELLGSSRMDSQRVVDGRLREFAERLSGMRRVFRQEPTELHYPGLPERPFHDRDAFPWLPELEAAAPAIREELDSLLVTRAEKFTPYVTYPPGTPLDQWASLNHSQRWSALHLLHYGQPVEEYALACPETMQQLTKLPQPVLAGRTPAAMFSVLQPGTHIPPHTGVANIRLVVHLPLIVPGNCRFRVGNETRTWREGEAWVFDDTIEHEAWNDSDSVRVILIADVWSPALCEEEKAAITELVAATDGFRGVAQMPL